MKHEPISDHAERKRILSLIERCEKEQEMIKCNTCEYCDVNTHSDEAYCEANDGEQIILHRGQCRPKWCPRRIRGEYANFGSLGNIRSEIGAEDESN